MGFEFHLPVLKKIEDFYVLETVDAVTFPTTYKDIQDNGIKKPISCLEKAKSLCLSLKKAVRENSLYKTIGKMGGILDNKKGEEKVAVCALVWPPKEVDEDEEEENDDEDDDGNDDKEDDEEDNNKEEHGEGDAVEEKDDGEEDLACIRF